ncbi:MAG: GC-type dockerin domain-anchored protein [Phycisphaerales bacterium]
MRNRVGVVALLSGVATALAQPVLTNQADPCRYIQPWPIGLSTQDGWTQFQLSQDSRVVYVSTSTGNNANSGLSESAPKRTILAGYALLRDGFPDWLLLKSGDTFDEAFPSWSKGGRSETEPMRIGCYGLGERPLIRSGDSNGFYAAAYPSPKAHLAITDLHFFPHTYAGDESYPPGGIVILNYWSDVLIENCRIEKYFVNVAVEGIANQGIPQRTRIRRSVIADSFRVGTAEASQGLFFAAKDLLLEENVVDHNGWRQDVVGAVPTIFRHNLYIHDSSTGTVVTRGNIVSRASQNGISQRCSGLVEGNLLLQNPVHIPAAGDALTIRLNVCLDSRDAGLGITLNGGGQVHVYENVIAHGVYGGGKGLHFVGTYDRLSVRKNVVYDWARDASPLAIAAQYEGAGTGLVDFVANELQQVRAGYLISDYPRPAGFVRYRDNRYFTMNPPPHQMDINMTYPAWVTRSGEQGSTFSRIAYPDPDRDIATYAATIGVGSSVEDFLAAAKKQSRANWRTDLTAAAVNGYIRAGFGRPMTACCPVDLDGDGRLNANDAVAFAMAFSAGDLRADFDGDLAFTVTDFVAFQMGYSQGCY